MAGYVWWFVIGFGLLVAELLTGTFYLLVIAVAMGAAGLARVESAFSAERMVKNTLRVYQRVAHSRTAASAQSEDSRPAT